ncbi:MAG: hypothetical protein KAJ60_00950 [Desulfobulbaceae bacterium]|nr:hypothetical protein [Desulfobulbaceae bacterium]
MMITSTLKRFICSLIGLGILCVGIMSYLDGGYYFTDLFVDFTPSRIPFSSYFILFGLLIICIALFGGEGYFEDENRVCPECYKTYLLGKLTDKLCPHCQVKTESVYTYFKKFPEKFGGFS